MSQNDEYQLIKVYVTREGRELLEFLVNRRINDRPAPKGAEMAELKTLKTELMQAGS